MFSQKPATLQEFSPTWTWSEANTAMEIMCRSISRPWLSGSESAYIIVKYSTIEFHNAPPAHVAKLV